jgi:hypothetical protein
VTVHRGFGGPVSLVNGDSHIDNSDYPLAAGSPWLATYGVTGSADNLERTVDGSDNNNDWLQVTINRPGSPSAISWQRDPHLSSAQMLRKGEGRPPSRSSRDRSHLSQSATSA